MKPGASPHYRYPIRQDRDGLPTNTQAPRGRRRQRLTSTTRLENVYDNSLNPTLNIWNGLRWQILYRLEPPG